MKIWHMGSTFKAPMSGDCGYHGHVGVGHTHLPELTKPNYVTLLATKVTLGLQ
jgi:hypothetical protein